LTVTERTRTDVARLTGAASESVRLAIALLADRRARLGDPAHADTAEAQIILGQTLLAAGHPAAARRHLEEAADTRRSRFLLTSYRVQEDLIWLAKTALVLGHPRTVLDLLAGQAAQTDWFRDQVSFRLGYTARRLAAMARGELGQAGEAAGDLLAARAELADRPLDAGLDSLAADFDRSLAELALMSGEAEDAADALVRLAEAETKGGAGGASRSGTGGASRSGTGGRTARYHGPLHAARPGRGVPGPRRLRPRHLRPRRLRPRRLGTAGQRDQVGGDRGGQPRDGDPGRGGQVHGVHGEHRAGGDQPGHRQDRLAQPLGRAAGGRVGGEQIAQDEQALGGQDRGPRGGDGAGNNAGGHGEDGAAPPPGCGQGRGSAQAGHRVGPGRRPGQRPGHGEQPEDDGQAG
jgi:hypothetical protein